MADTDLITHAAAMLAADVAGYSRLMSQDARATVVALDEARALFRSHIVSCGGRVIDMTGDAVLAMFDNGRAAVAAGTAVQRGLQGLHAGEPDARRMRFRIGIHVGDVIEKADGTVYGDVVNIAARMQTYAPSGSLVVSQAVAQSLDDVDDVDVVDMGELYLHNIARPVRMVCLHVVHDDAWPQPGQVPPGNDARPSIAVLPFRKHMSHANEAYFADGIVDDIVAPR